MTKSLLVLLLIMWLALTVFAQSPEIIIADTSQSQSQWGIQSRTEQKLLIAAFPTDAQLLILGVGNSVRRLYEGPLDPAHRAAANATIDALPMKDQHTALGESLAEALRLTAVLPGKSKNIWIFTDGQNSPPAKSPFRGQHFNRILDETVVPSDTQIYVRVFGGEQVSSSKPSIHILKSTPTWNTLIPPPTDTTKAASSDRSQITNHPTKPVSREILPIIGIILMLAAGTVIAIVVVILLRRKRANEIIADVRPINIQQPETPDEPQPQKLFSIFIDGRTDPILLGTNHCTEVVIGGSATADIYIPACDQQTARFTLDSARAKQAITIRNDGIGEIEVGRRKLPTGSTVRLPDKPVEMRIGSQIVHVLGETVFTGGMA